jgi:hypothetical protein
MKGTLFAMAVAALVLAAVSVPSGPTSLEPQ